MTNSICSLGQLRSIPHVEFLRIGTRIPIFLPQRITPELCAMLKQYHPLFISVHSNHPRELTTEVRAAVGRLADAGHPRADQDPAREAALDRALTELACSAGADTGTMQWEYLLVTARRAG